MYRPIDVWLWSSVTLWQLSTCRLNWAAKIRVLSFGSAPRVLWPLRRHRNRPKIGLSFSLFFSSTATLIYGLVCFILVLLRIRRRRSRPVSIQPNACTHRTQCKNRHRLYLAFWLLSRLRHESVGFVAYFHQFVQLCCMRWTETLKNERLHVSLTIYARAFDSAARMTIFTKIFC